MEITKISYSAVVKNKHRPSAKWWGRIRQDGRERWVPLNTQDKSEADKWVARMKNILFQVNEYEERGEPVPEDLLSKLVVVDKATFFQRVANQPITAPGSLLDRWEEDMVLKGSRRTTIDNYRRVFATMFGDCRIESLDATNVRMLFSATKKIKDSTRRFYSNACRSLFRFMRRPDLVEAVPKVKADEADHHFFSPEEMDRIWRSVKCNDKEREDQYKLYFRLLIETGCRNTEGRMLRWKDVEDATVKFVAGHTKGRRTRTVPISRDLFAVLDTLRGEPEDDVFPLVSRSETARYKVFKRACRKLGLSGTMHDLRRSRAMEIYRKTKDIRVASQWLGDSEIVALKHYIEDASVEDLRSAVLGER
jgi:integrase